MSMKAKSDATHYNLPKPKIVKDGPQPGPSDLEKKAAKADAWDGTDGETLDVTI